MVLDWDPRGLQPFAFPTFDDFRRLFRHSYDFQIEGEKLQRLASAWHARKELALAALDQFRAWLLARSVPTNH